MQFFLQSSFRPFSQFAGFLVIPTSLMQATRIVVGQMMHAARPHVFYANEMNEASEETKSKKQCENPKSNISKPTHLQAKALVNDEEVSR